jgi:tRNA (adenine37-N6)-methyltransferase
MNIEFAPVAMVKNSRSGLKDDYWGTVTSEIKLLPHIPADAFNGIDQFSHLEIIFYFNRSDKSKIVFHGHPRGNKDWPDTGIFAMRKKDRPNSIGLTIVELVKREGNTIWVKYLDAIDGTPVLDIKPVMKEFLPTIEIKQPAWSTELMANYWKE